MRKRGITVFAERAKAYDDWFEANPSVYRSEVDAFRQFVPRSGDGVETGVGTGRFVVKAFRRVAVRSGASPTPVPSST